MVDRLRVGRVFLAGDAAHVHPIAGGLGMNSGIQDAYNLGWKLGLVLAGAAAPGLLDTYDEERLPIASWLLDITSARLDAALAAIEKPGGGVDAVASAELSQLTLGYRWSRLSRDAADRSGDRRLRAATGHRTRPAVIRSPARGYACSTCSADRISPCSAWVNAAPRRSAPSRRPSCKPYLIGPGGLIDDGGHVARAYGEDALILVRPDGYVGLIADADDTSAVAGYLRSL